MSIDWQVPELGTDFTQDFEDTIIQYIFDKWSINNPEKDSQMQTDESDKVQFKAGFSDFSQPYEVCCVQTRTQPLEKIDGKFVFTTGLDVMVRMQRINRDAIDFEPELENMEEEIMRIVEDYVPNEIVGIKDLIYGQPSVERVYNARDSFAKSDWRSIIHIQVFYEKEDTS
jgi:hypothetical protein